VVKEGCSYRLEPIEEIFEDNTLTQDVDHVFLLTSLSLFHFESLKSGGAGLQVGGSSLDVVSSSLDVEESANLEIKFRYKQSVLNIVYVR
jgi:hypothetical protein